MHFWHPPLLPFIIHIFPYQKKKFILITKFSWISWIHALVAHPRDKVAKFLPSLDAIVMELILGDDSDDEGFTLVILRCFI